MQKYYFLGLYISTFYFIGQNQLIPPVLFYRCNSYNTHWIIFLLIQKVNLLVFIAPLISTSKNKTFICKFLWKFWIKSIWRIEIFKVWKGLDVILQNSNPNWWHALISSFSLFMKQDLYTCHNLRDKRWLKSIVIWIIEDKFLNRCWKRNSGLFISEVSIIT